MMYTSDNIEELKDNQVFVFGSNLSGLHGLGAARTALEKFGAKAGIGKGMQGQSYAIPTKDKSIQTMPLSAIDVHVKNFIEFAKENPQYEFLVTKVGCGLAGYTPKEIAPLFAGALKLSNVILPREFVLKLF